MTTYFLISLGVMLPLRYSHLVMLIIFLTEYEMCLQDTLELEWHFDCKSRHLRQVQNQILQTETVIRKIEDYIDCLKKHSPLLEEKLNLEGEAVKEALLAYEKVSTSSTKMFLLEPFHSVGAPPCREQQVLGRVKVCPTFCTQRLPAVGPQHCVQAQGTGRIHAAGLRLS